MVYPVRPVCNAMHPAGHQGWIIEHYSTLAGHICIHVRRILISLQINLSACMHAYTYIYILYGHIIYTIVYANIMHAHAVYDNTIVLAAWKLIFSAEL